MNRILIFLTGCILLTAHCKEQKKSVLPFTVPRDTTISLQNAYSDLFIDSVYVEAFLRAEGTVDSTVHKIRNFYNARNFSFAWFNEEGLTIQGAGFWNTHNRYVKQSGDSSIYDEQLHRLMDDLLNADTSCCLQKDTLNLMEVKLTKHFFDYVQTAYQEKVSPEQMQWYIPRKKLEPVVLLDSLIAKSVDAGDWKPLNQLYYRLQDAVFRFHTIEEKGGWKQIDVSGRKWEIGEQHKIIRQIKLRLQQSGDFLPGDTSLLFTGQLQTAVKRMEQAFGMKTDGVIDEALIRALNVPVEVRLRQMLINLERVKWMPEQQQDCIVANIPEYRLHVYEKGKEVLGMDIVVGRAANQTVIFSNVLKDVVFSPYWNIPRSIVRKELLPAMRRKRGYLRRHNMEITGYHTGLPVIRQKPGAGNALGRVKFLFPNRYSIYFHDTPAKSLFGREKRAFSHGCIRLQQPFVLARYLLRNDSAWTGQKIREAMMDKTEKWVTLEEPIPVLITYFTAWVDKQGLVHFRDDVYGHDMRMAEYLFL